MSACSKHPRKSWAVQASQDMAARIRTSWNRTPKGFPTPQTRLHVTRRCPGSSTHGAFPCRFHAYVLPRFPPSHGFESQARSAAPDSGLVLVPIQVCVCIYIYIYAHNILIYTYIAISTCTYIYVYVIDSCAIRYSWIRSSLDLSQRGTIIRLRSGS